MDEYDSNDDFNIGLDGFFDDEDESTTKLKEHPEKQETSSLISLKNEAVAITNDAIEIDSSFQQIGQEGTLRDPELKSSAKDGK